MMKLSEKTRTVTAFEQELTIPENTICLAKDASGDIYAMMGLPYIAHGTNYWSLHYEEDESENGTYVQVGKCSNGAGWNTSVIEVQ